MYKVTTTEDTTRCRVPNRVLPWPSGSPELGAAGSGGSLAGGSPWRPETTTRGGGGAVGRRLGHSIDIMYHNCKDLVKRGVVKFEYVPSAENVADIFTKNLRRVKLEKFRES